MKVRFTGLICHVEAQGVHRAVLIDADGHHPRLVYKKSAVVGQPDNDNTTVCEDLTDTLVTYSAVGDVDTRGLQPVPSLTEIAPRGILDLRVVAGQTVQDKFHGLVAIAAGSYGVESYFPELAAFDVNVEQPPFPRCLPQIVVLDVPTTTPVAFVLTNQRTHVTTTIDFKPLSTVTIINAEEVGTPSQLGHFQQFGQIYETPLPVPIPRPVRTGSCSHGSRTLDVAICPKRDAQALTVECANTRYP